MSDTSGSGGFGPATRAIRTALRITFGPAEREGGQAKARGADVLGGGDQPILQTAVWWRLDKGDMLEDVLLPPELLYYLEQMARFIDGAKKGGLPGVVRALGLREDSQFPSLRRAITRRAPGNAESRDEGSEQHGRAGGAFNAGSARWAVQMSGLKDPTQVSIRQLVDEIGGDRYDEALLLAARRILEEYGERLFRGLIREDDPWGEPAAKRLIADFGAQLDAFFAKYSSATDWSASRLAKTLERFPAFVKKGQ